MLYRPWADPHLLRLAPNCPATPPAVGRWPRQRLPVVPSYGSSFQRSGGRRVLEWIRSPSPFTSRRGVPCIWERDTGTRDLACRFLAPRQLPSILRVAAVQCRALRRMQLICRAISALGTREALRVQMHCSQRTPRPLLWRTKRAHGFALPTHPTGHPLRI